MDMQIKTLLPGRPWEVAALAQARRNALEMVERSMKAAEGDLLAIRTAIPDAFLREIVRRAANPDSRACMQCHGSGCRTDPESGPCTCDDCDGMGLLAPVEEGGRTNS